MVWGTVYRQLGGCGGKRPVCVKHLRIMKKSDMVSSLTETMNLYRDLALEVSRAYGFTYPAHADEYSTGWVHEKLNMVSMPRKAE